MNVNVLKITFALLLLGLMGCRSPGASGEAGEAPAAPRSLQPAAESKAQAAAKAGGAETDEMVTVPSGSFWMGCNEEWDRGCRPTEFPYRRVEVPAFRIDRTVVTQAEYARCVADEVCAAPASRDECAWDPESRAAHPVTCIDWFKAREYCDWAGKRLCSEAEWEKAARGNDGRIYPWGNERPTCELMHNSRCGDEPLPVGSRPKGASPYGALEMAGNVREWVEDDWFPSYEGAPDDGSPRVAEPRKRQRVRRGCCFRGMGGSLRTSARMSGPPAQDDSCFGIRCCADPALRED